MVMNQIPPREPWWRGPFWRFVLIGVAYIALMAAIVCIMLWAF
jgi:hypothetical protein